MEVSKRIVLHYPPTLTEKPIVCELVKNYNITFNILRANFSADGEGMLLLELTGEKRNLSKSLKFLKEVGVKTELVGQDVTRLEKRCVHCGICSLVCPTAAFYIESRTQRVELEPARCMGCEECVKMCPYNAIKVSFV